MNNHFKLGFRCANDFLPVIQRMPNKEFLLHYLKGLAITIVGYTQAHAYEVNNKIQFGEFDD